jgi:superfamily II DNA helicase RecQ
MQVKLFTNRIDADTIATDQQAINSFMETVTVKSTATQFVSGPPDYWSILVFYENKENNHPHLIPPDNKQVLPETKEQPLSEEETQVLTALKIWRKEKANELQQPEFLIFSNATLIALARSKPRSVTELSTVKGLGQAKITRFGDDLMSILNAF